MKNLVILAGGRSSRMGSDKALLELDGETFLEHLARSAETDFDRVLISMDTERHAETICRLPYFQRCKPEVIIDGYSELGPMGGLCSVLEQTDLKRFAVIPVDVPFADMRVLSALYDLCKNGAAVLLGEDGFPEPLIGAYDRECLACFQKAIAEGDYRLRKVLERVGCRMVPVKELAEAKGCSSVQLLQSFRNINNPEDYVRYTTGGIK